jgi:hypothetical protein
MCSPLVLLEGSVHPVCSEQCHAIERIQASCLRLGEAKTVASGSSAVVLFNVSISCRASGEGGAQDESLNKARVLAKLLKSDACPLDNGATVQRGKLKGRLR